MYGLHGDLLVMLSLTLMTVGMQRMQYVNWMVRMAGELSFLTIQEEEVVVDGVAVVVVLVVRI